MKKAFLLAAVSAAAMTCAATASAAIMTATWTGVVHSSFDYTGVFGGSGSSLDGMSFVAHYTYDTSLGYRATSPGVSDVVLGGSAYLLPAVVSGTLTINGVTHSIGGGASGLANTLATFVGDETGDQSNDGEFYTENMFSNQGSTSGTPTNLEAIVPLTTVDGTGYFQIYTFDLAMNVSKVFAYGALANATYQVQADALPPPAPEPATWALMLGGFALAGVALRRCAPTAA